MLLEIGQSIGSYIIVRLLRESQWRHDYLGRERTSGREVIVSIFDVVESERDAFVGRLRQKSTGIDGLESFNFIEVHSIGALRDGTPLVISTPPSGINLAEAVKSDAQWGDPVRALTLIQNLSRVLGSAETQAVFDNSFSPENVFIQQDGELLIVDAHIPPISDAHIAAAPDYVAPEYSADTDLTEQGLIYSFGILLYELLAGEHPKEQGWDITAMGEERIKPPTLEKKRSGLSQGTYELIHQALQTRPWARFPNFAEFERRLAQALEGERIAQGLKHQITKRKNVAVTKKRVIAADSELPVQDTPIKSSKKPRLKPAAKKRRPRWLTPILILLTVGALWFAGSFLFEQFSAATAPNQNLAPTPTKEKGFTLINPLRGQFFTEDTTIYFSWSFGRPLEAEESFHIRLFNADESTIDLENITVPFNGRTYQMGTDEIPVGEYEWQVGLYQNDQETALQTSKRLPISILESIELEDNSAETDTPSP